MTPHTTTSWLPAWLFPSTAITGLLLVILYALGILGGGEKIAPGHTPPVKLSLPANAQLFTVTQTRLEQFTTWQGTVRSRTWVALAPKFPARLLGIEGQPGDHVQQGALLISLDDRDLRAAYQAAQAAFTAAHANAVQADQEAQRITELFTKQAATKQHYQAVLAQAQASAALANQAQSAAKQSAVLLGENKLYAPFAGVIGERLIEPGTLVMPNQTVLTLFKADDLRLEVAISQQCASSVQVGLSVTIHSDIEQALQGRVDEISPQTDPDTRTRMIKISLPASQYIQQGQLAWVELSCDHQHAASASQSMLIPRAAIIQYGQLQAVTIVRDQHTEIRHIRTGKQFNEQYEVLSGLHEGETILVNNGLQP
jgi:RND family efflux transporter MFP subunit